MSQRVVYECDQCGKEIGKKAHISIRMYHQDGATGIAVPQGTGGKTGGWQVVRSLPHFSHFCNGKCIGAYMDAKIKEASEKK